MPTLTERRNATLAEARKLAEQVDPDKGFTADGRRKFDELLAESDRLAAMIKSGGLDEDRIRRIGALSPTGDAPTTHLRFDPKSFADRYLDTLRTTGSLDGSKALLAPGTGATVPIEQGNSPVDAGRPAQGLLDVLVAQPSDREFSYLRQTARTNAAAFVAPGEVKPTSAYTLTRVEDRLRVIAHLAEPVDRFWLEDAPSLAQFVGDELGHGLRLALEDAILNGDGTGETPTGLGRTSGIQAQPFTTTALRTSRTALTKVETVLGDVPGWYVMHPVDWENIETSTIDTGGYVLAEAGGTTPVERAQRRLWGQPVALSLACTPGTGYLVAAGAATLLTDRQGVRVDWSTSGDDFTRNQLRARCEGRFALTVTRPLGVVKVALAEGVVLI